MGICEPSEVRAVHERLMVSGDVREPIVVGIVLILLPSLIFASVASLPKGEVEVITMIAYPIALAW